MRAPNIGLLSLGGLGSAPVAVEPVGLAATPDEGRIVVTSGWGRKLSTLDAGTLEPGFEVDLAREPRAVLVDDDGRRRIRCQRRPSSPSSGRRRR